MTRVNTTVSVLVDGLDHPEGVAWGRDGFLYAGGEAGQVYRIDVDRGTAVQFASTGGFVLGLAWEPRGGLVACDLARREVVRIDPGGAVEALSAGAPDAPFRAPNHLAFDDAGRLYVSDSGTWDADDGVVMRIDPDGTTRVWTDAAARFPNGVAIDQSGTWLYVVESTLPGVSRVHIEPSGRPGAREVVVTLGPDVVPDGLAFDERGALLIACYRPDRIYRWTAEDGLDVVAEDPRGTDLAAPTNLAFGGAGGGRLFSANLGRWHIAEVSYPARGLALR